jgi:hypothetical protein
MSDTQSAFLIMGCIILIFLFISTAPHIGRWIWGNKKVAPNPKKYIVQAFDSNQQMEDYINEVSEHFEAVSISDTNRCITVLLRRKD